MWMLGNNLQSWKSHITSKQPSRMTTIIEHSSFKHWHRSYIIFTHSWPWEDDSTSSVVFKSNSMFIWLSTWGSEEHHRGQDRVSLTGGYSQFSGTLGHEINFSRWWKGQSRAWLSHSSNTQLMEDSRCLSNVRNTNNVYCTSQIYLIFCVHLKKTCAKTK